MTEGKSFYSNLQDTEKPLHYQPPQKTEDSNYVIYDSLVSLELVISIAATIFYISLHVSTLLVALSISGVLVLGVGCILTYLAKSSLDTKKQAYALIAFCLAAVICVLTSATALNVISGIFENDKSVKDMRMYSMPSNSYDDNDSNPYYDPTYNTVDEYDDPSTYNSYFDPYSGSGYYYSSGSYSYSTLISGYGYSIAADWVYSYSVYDQYSTNYFSTPDGYYGFVYSDSTQNYYSAYVDTTFDFDGGYSYSTYSQSYSMYISDFFDTTYSSPIYGSYSTYSQSSSSYSGYTSGSYSNNGYNPYGSQSTLDSTTPQVLMKTTRHAFVGSFDKVIPMILFPVQICLFIALIYQASVLRRSMKFAVENGSAMSNESVMMH